jgi:BMFP domain-containing protein YqiC
MLSHVLGRVARTSLSTDSRLLARVEELEARLSRQAQRAAELVRERDQALSKLGQVTAACSRPSDPAREWTHDVLGHGPERTRRRDLKRQRATIVARERARAAEARVVELENRNRQLLATIRSARPAAKEACPGAVACDGIVKASIARRLLYIGGRSGGIEHLRRVAADVGAELLHHDGGEHEAIGRIDGFVERCDAVFCPIDCISHSACLRAKALCQRLGKPFVPLRTSGTTSFQRAISTLTGS